MGPVKQEERAIVLFDGVCHLCNGAVRWIIRRDRRGRFRFASLQSETGSALLSRYGVQPGTDSMVLIEGGRWYPESTAALRIARRLDGLWPLAYVLIIVPRPLRDSLYRYIARRRYRWFGRSETCMIPDSGIRERFLD